MTKHSLRLLVAFWALVPLAIAAAQGLSVVPMEYRDLDTTYSTEAVIEAVRQSTISAQVMGCIVELGADGPHRPARSSSAQVVASSEAQLDPGRFRAWVRANL
jgi:hypothetical protein